MLKPIEKQRVAEEIVEQLRSLILTGQYAVGDKLPPERELAKKLGVNRASLREALKKLEHVGLLRIRQGDGTRVTNFMETAGIDLVRHLMPLASSGSIEPAIAQDVFEFRRVIGRATARLAAERSNEADIATLQAIAARAGDPELDIEALFRIDFEFYVALTGATRNKVMVLLINTVRDSVAAYGPLLAHLTMTRESVMEHHRNLIDALVQHDKDRAAEIADAYLARGAAHVATLLDAGSLKPPASATEPG